MGLVIELKTGAADGECGPPTIDRLTAEVATVIWRLGGCAPIDEITRAMTVIRGGDLVIADRGALAMQIQHAADARVAAGRAPLLYRPVDALDDWALTDLTRSLLGELPCE